MRMTERKTGAVPGSSGLADRAELLQQTREVGAQPAFGTLIVRHLIDDGGDGHLPARESVI